MKFNVLAVALAASVAGSFAANAQVVIEQPAPPPAVVVEPAPSSSVTVHEDHGIFGKKTKTIETNGFTDCTTRTEHTEDIGGRKTVRSTNCD